MNALNSLAKVVIAILIGILVHRISQDRKKRVFISFDYDNDHQLKKWMIAQSKRKNSPFEIMDYSLKEAAPERDWEKKAWGKICQSDLVMVLLGRHTHKAPGVLKEVKMARKAGKPIIQVKGHNDYKLNRVSGAGKLYRWSWENLRKILS